MSKTRSHRFWLSSVLILMFAASTDCLLLDYLVAQGFEIKSQTLNISTLQFSFPLVLLPFVGLMLVTIAAWANISPAVPLAVAKETTQLESIRLLRAAGITIFCFSVTLYGPYVVGANAFWSLMSSLSGSIPQLGATLQDLFSSMQPAANWDLLTKFSVSQNAAGLVLVLVSILLSRGQRRIRRAK
jgi:hypothetical protein